MTWLKARMMENAEKTAEIWINGQIGDWSADDGVTSKYFIDEVNALGELNVIHLKINSPGGSVADGLTIYNFLRQHPARINVMVMAQAASIASVIAMAGDQITMAVGAVMMVHNPMAPVIFGNARDLRKTADDLDIIESGVMEAYAVKTGMDASVLKPLLDAVTYMNGTEAVERGFADQVDVELKAVASEEISTFNIRLAMVTASKEAEIRSRDAEIKTLETRLADKNKTLESLQAPPADAGKIVDQLSAAGLEFMASSLIKQRLPEAMVATRIAGMNALKDRCASLSIDPREVISRFDDPADMLGYAIHEALAAAEQDTDASHLPGTGHSQARIPDVQAVYARLNQPTGT